MKQARVEISTEVQSFGGFGLVLGLAAGIAAADTIRSLLYGVEPQDATVFASIPVILLCVASAACLLRAGRASRLDPLQARRTE